jgi:hypothetical protein
MSSKRNDTFKMNNVFCVCRTCLKSLPSQRSWTRGQGQRTRISSGNNVCFVCAELASRATRPRDPGPGGRGRERGSAVGIMFVLCVQNLPQEPPAPEILDPGAGAENEDQLNNVLV